MDATIGTLSRTKVIRDFLSADTMKPVTLTEFMEFWKACAEPAREQYYNEVLALQTA